MPIEQGSIALEKHTLQTGWRRGREVSRIFANGHGENPDTYLYKRGVSPRDINLIRSPRRILDVKVNSWGQIIEGYGLWEKIGLDRQIAQDRLLADTQDLPMAEMEKFCRELTHLGMKEWSTPIPGPIRSIYFLPRNRADISYSMRARSYGVPEQLKDETIYISPADPAVLEIKEQIGDHESSNRRREVKFRQTGTVGKIVSAINALPDASRQMDTPRSRSVPYGYPQDAVVPERVFIKLYNLSEKWDPAFVLGSERSHWVMNVNQPDLMRVTVTYNSHYHKFLGDKVGTCISLGSYPNARVEIKITNLFQEPIAKEIQEKLKSLGSVDPYIRNDAKRVFYWSQGQFSSSNLPMRIEA